MACPTSAPVKSLQSIINLIPTKIPNSPCLIIPNDLLQDATLRLASGDLNFSTIALAALTAKVRCSTTKAKLTAAYLALYSATGSDQGTEFIH